MDDEILLKNALLEEYRNRWIMQMLDKKPDAYIQNMKEKYPKETSNIDSDIASFLAEHSHSSYEEYDSSCEEEKQGSIPPNIFSIGTLKVMLEVLPDVTGINFLESIKERYIEAPIRSRFAGGAKKYTKDELDRNEDILLTLTGDEMEILQVLLAP